MEKLADLSVLVVDDNDHIDPARAAASIRGQGGSRVAQRPSWAWADPGDLPPISSIIDYHMVARDGISFIPLVRRSKDSPNPRVPILMLTDVDRSH